MAALAVLWWANHMYYRANRRYLWAVQSAADARVRASEDVVHTGQEAARLRHLDTALGDWADIIGWVLHHPHAGVDDLKRDMDASVVETLPAAFAIAHIAQEEEIRLWAAATQDKTTVAQQQGSKLNDVDADAFVAGRLLRR